jgi:hypothetical protein
MQRGLRFCYAEPSFFAKPPFAINNPVVGHCWQNEEQGRRASDQPDDWKQTRISA